MHHHIKFGKKMVERFRRYQADTIGHTNRTTVGQTNRVIPIYPPPPPTFIRGGVKDDNLSAKPHF